jgi:chromate reductase
MSKVKILALSGSTRRESFNSRLLAAAATMAEKAGAEVTVIKLDDFPLPIMNQDLESEEGQPENAVRLKQLFVESDGLLIASPEYNSSISPLLKNTLDWVSRRAGDEPPAVAYKGKTVALLSASPGRLGGIRGLVHVRSVLNALGSLVLADQGTVSSAFSAFDDDGNLINDHDVERIESVTRQLVDILTRLSTD